MAAPRRSCVQGERASGRGYRASTGAVADTESRFLYPRHVAFALTQGLLRMNDLTDARFMRQLDATVRLSDCPGPYGVMTIEACGSDGVARVLDHLTWPFWDVRPAAEGIDRDGPGHPSGDLRMLVHRGTAALAERIKPWLEQCTGADVYMCPLDCPNSDERVVQFTGPPGACTECVRLLLDAEWHGMRYRGPVLPRKRCVRYHPMRSYAGLENRVGVVRRPPVYRASKCVLATEGRNRGAG